MRKFTTLFTRVAVMAVMLLSAMTVAAQSTGVPEISKYYPGVSTPPQELRSTTKCYVYFKTGAKVYYAKAQVIQNGNVVGTVEYVSKSETTTTTTPVMDQTLPANACIQDLEPGLVDLVIYEVKYIDGADGETKIHSDLENPLGSVTYQRPVANGTVVSETGLEDKMVLSYYPADATDGVKTITFSKAVKPDNIKPFLEYGIGDVKRSFALPWTLSDDGCTLTIDLRGVCHNIDALAPGVEFTDEFGNPVDPPVVINLQVDGLDCVDGTKIQFVTTSLDGMYSHTITGYVMYTYNYTDITFETPTIVSADFYAAANPGVRSLIITNSTDMMDLQLTKYSHLVSAGVSFTIDDAVYTVPAAEVTLNLPAVSVAIPEEVRQLGSSNLTVSLCDAVYDAEDGAPHVVNQYAFSNKAVSVSDIASLKELVAGTKVVLYCAPQTYVTLSKDGGYMFMEDATGGIQLVTVDYSRILTEETAISGELGGVYQGNGVFLIDPAQCKYTETPGVMAEVPVANDLSELLIGMFDSCLVTLTADNFEFQISDDYIIADNAVTVVPELVADFAMPEVVKAVTGVLYNAPGVAYSSTPNLMLLLRKQADVVGEVSGISDIDADTADADVYDLRGVLVRRAGDATQLPCGLYISAGRKLIVK